MHATFPDLGLRLRKVSNIKINLQGHSTSSASMTFDKPHTISC